MVTRTAYMIPMRIVKNGGATHKLLKAGGSNDFAVGSLLRKTSGGTWKPIPADQSSDTAVTVASEGDAGIHAIVTEAYDNSEDGANYYITIQEITVDTILEAQFSHATAASATAAAQTDIGDQYGLYWDTDNDVMVVDEGETSDVLVELYNTGDNWQYMKPEADEQYNLCRFKVLASVIQTAPAA